MKRYHFLSGLFRSGNTLLAALLNQHPETYVSPLSPLASLLWNSHVQSLQDEHIKRNRLQHHRYMRIQSAMANVMYYDVEKPVVLDREKDWGHPQNIELALTYIAERPKIVTTVRSIPDVIASYINIDRNGLLQEAKNEFEFGAYHRQEIDAIADHVMRPNGNIERSLFSIANSLKDDRVDVHLVEYDDLISKPSEVMYGIQDFLGISKFEHSFDNIEKIEIDTDVDLGFGEDLHKVRPKLERSEVRAEDILPERIIRKYSGMEFWRN